MKKVTTFNPLIDAMFESDLEQVRRIYIEGLETGNATFETTAPSWNDWNNGHLQHSRLAVRKNGDILGWAALSPISKRKVYSGVAEVSVYVGASDRGKGIGFLLLMHRSEDVAQFRYFYIEREYRRIGLGTKLMCFFMDFLKEKGYKSAYLWTTNEQTAAAKIYQRYGFELTEEKESVAFGKLLREQRFDLILTN